MIYIGTVLVLLAFLLRRHPKRSANVFLLCLSVVLCLFGLEAVLEVRAVGPHVWAAWKNGVVLDQRSKADVVRQRRQQLSNTQPAVVPIGLVETNGLRSGEGRVFPLGGTSGSEVVFCNEQGAWVTYRADEYGFRNPSAADRSTEVDLALVGDSFVQGQCVAEGQDIASWLRKTGRGVLSFGMSGNGPLLELGLLVEYVAPLRPPVVVWAVYEGNDAGELERERTSAILMSYLQPGFSQDLSHRQQEIDGAWHRYIERRLAIQPDSQAATRGRNSRLREFFRLQTLRQSLVGRSPELSTSELRPFDPLMAAILSEARDRVASWGGQLYVLYLPDLEMRSTRDAIRRDSLRMFDELGLPVIDMTEPLAAAPNSKDLYPAGRNRVHFNSAGYRLIADVLATQIPN